MAGRISEETIEQVRNTADIVEVVGEYTKLTKRGGNDYWGCCPFHHEKTASFRVDTDRHFYYCFGCHAAGNTIKFVMEMEKLSYVEAIESLAKKAGIPVRYSDGYNSEAQKKSAEFEQYLELYDRITSMFHYFLMETEQGKRALEYIRGRGLGDDILEKFRLGYAPADRRWLKTFLLKKNFSEEFLSNSGLFSKNYKDVALFSDRLMFPIFNRKGQAVAFGGRILHPQGPDDRKYLNSPELPHYKKRETLFAFNFAKSSIRTSKRVIFCEGYMDCIAYHACGIEYAVAPLGTALTDEQVRMVQGFAETVLLSFDSDGAGQQATKRAILLCRQHDLTVKIIQLKGGKDPAEIMVNFGREYLTNQVEGAILDIDYLLNKLGKLYPVDTPEGKTKAALEFFPYVDALQSSIQRESSLEQLSQAFNLKPEAVLRDFKNRNQAQERLNIRQNKQDNPKTQLTLNAELRGLIAVIADFDQFKILRSELTEIDFKNPDARRLFRILEECFTNQTYTIPDILAKCEDSALVQQITKDISTGVYQKEEVGPVVQDTIKFVKKNKIDDQRNAIIKRIREYVVVTEDDKLEMKRLLEKKIELDTQAQLFK